jgi:hypothetical protein
MRILHKCFPKHFLRTYALMAFFVICAIVLSAFPVNAQEVSFSDFVGGNIRLGNGYYDSIRVRTSDNEFVSHILEDIVFTGVTISHGRITHANGAEPFRAYNLDLGFAGGEITVSHGKVYLTAKLYLPQIFSMAEAAEGNGEPDISTAADRVEESVQIYFDGENVGFGQVSLGLPDLIMVGVGSLTGVVFQLRTDPSFYLHVGGGIHLSAAGDSDASPGIDTELEVGIMERDGDSIPALKKFEIGASGLDINLDGMEITFLQGADLSVGDVFIDLDNLGMLGGMFLSGKIILTVLPAVDGLSVLEIDAGGKIKPWPIYISIFSETKLFGMFDMSDSTVTYWYPNHFSYSVSDYVIPGVLSINGTLSAGSWRDEFLRNACPGSDWSSWDTSTDGCVVNALNDWGNTNLGFCSTVDEAKSWDTLFHGEIGVDFSIPDSVPIVGGKSLFGGWGRVTQDYIYGRIDPWWSPWYASALLEFAVGDVVYNGGWKINEIQPTNSWEIPYNQYFIFEKGMDSVVSLDRWKRMKSARSMSGAGPDRVALLTFMNNWKQVDASTTGSGMKPFERSRNGNNVTTLQIPEGVPAAIIRLNYENENVEGISMKLTMPDGTILNFTDGFQPDGYSNVNGYSQFRPAAREGFFVLDSPAGGDYIVTVENEQELGNFTVEALVMNHPAEVEIISIEPVEGTNEYEVKWRDSDPDDSSSVYVYVDTDRKEGNGFLIGAYPEDDEIDSHTFDTTSLNVPAGDYYVAVGVSDGKYGIVWDYSEQRIHIEDPDLADPVQGISVTAGDGQFTATWTPSEDANVVGYEVLWTENDMPGHFEGRLSINGREKNQLTIEDLKNGVPYLVTVIALDNYTERSHPENIVRVIPHKSNRTTSYVSTSEPCQYARIGELYVHMPKFPDSERYTPYGIEMKWNLVAGPEGLTVRESDGFVQWTPSEDQRGDHSITLERSIYLTGALIETVDDSFELVVRYAHEMQSRGNTANHVLSSPELTAVKGEKYDHQIQIHDLNGTPTFRLMEGPSGMVCSDSGLLSWQVPEDAKGSPVRVKVTYADGEEEGYEYFLDVMSQPASDSSGICFISSLLSSL